MLDFATYQLIAGAGLVLALLSLLIVCGIWFDRFCEKHGVDDWPELPPKTKEEAYREAQR